MMTAKEEPKVFVVMPNKNGIQHLKYSIPSLMGSKYSNFYCVLVDDHSSDGSLAFIEKNYPDITVIRNRSTKGFAGSVNLGITYSLEQGAEYIAVYNSDIKVLPQWIDLTIDIFNHKEKIGLVGYSEITTENDELFYGSTVSRDTVDFKEVKQVAGCLYICVSEVFARVGFFDENYFMYGEDNDLFSRLTMAGYSIIETSIPVLHYGEGSSQLKFISTWLAYRNALRFSIKNENLIQTVRMFLSLLNQGCNPFLSMKKNDPNFKRLRRYNIVVNFILIIASSCWNVVNIISTLKSRYSARRQIRMGNR